MRYLISKKVNLATVVEGKRKAPFFNSYYTKDCTNSPFYTYLILLSVKQGSINYHVLSPLYEATGYWTQVSRTIREHSNH